MEGVPVNAGVAKGASFHTVALKQSIVVQQNRSERGEGFEEYLTEKRASLSIPRKPTRKEQVANLLQLRRLRDAAVAQGKALNIRLTQAAESGDLAEVETCVREGADLDCYDHYLKDTRTTKNSKGKTYVTVHPGTLHEASTPLHAATNGGHLDVVQFLVESGASLDLQSCIFGDTPILAAAKLNLLPIVRYFVEQGADLESKNYAGETILHACCRAGHSAIATYFLELCPDWDVNTYTRTGCTAFFVACQGGHFGAATVLKNHGCHLDQWNNSMVTPLHAASRDGHLEMVQILVGWKVNLYLCDQSGATPFMAACKEGHVHTATWMVNKEKGAGIDPEKVDIVSSCVVSADARRKLLMLYLEEASFKDMDPFKDIYNDMLMKCMARPRPEASISDKSLKPLPTQYHYIEGKLQAQLEEAARIQEEKEEKEREAFEAAEEERLFGGF
jgi:ankyrin repeat protein